MWLGEAKTPDGMRLYAIGDVHGCDRLLQDAYAAIAADLDVNPVADHRIIHVGDYVDRGPASAGVIERLSALSESDSRVVCLLGNHDQMVRDFLADPVGAGPLWLTNGGDATLRSYGLDAFGTETRRRLRDLRDRFAAVLPAAHLDFFEGLSLAEQLGDFFFCHAGIRPGVPLDEQSPEDLVWIRDEFLSDARDHGVVVVHGHTPQSSPEVLPNRINVDTGAVFGGPLTVLALEGTGYRFL
ncbi:MAG: serine/threonine protein phosphatase [Bauldia sp.]|uniref:metallophosphoesterase family protein n=1 Tax=Bauldia sp. TaxID=2575872 RepID=UPI001D1D1340|nr:metallophosphoesterase family protein [Bauldia sp.]MCB1496914.1 serine/threonine protein phosphatase [Bauldia sp.]